MDQLNHNNPAYDAPEAQNNQLGLAPAQLVNILSQLSAAAIQPGASLDQLIDVIFRLTVEATQPGVTTNQLMDHLNHIIDDVFSRPANRPNEPLADAHPLAAVPLRAPEEQLARDPLWEDLVDAQKQFKAPIQGFSDARARYNIYLASRNLVVEPAAPDIPAPRGNEGRRLLAASLKNAILQQDQVPESQRRKDGFRHLIEDRRWCNAEVDLLVWKLMEYAEAAAEGKCRIPGWHEAKPTPYRQFDTYHDRLLAIEAVLLENKTTVESCFKNDAFCARLAWNPGKELKRKAANAAVNDSRSKTAKGQQQDQHLEQDQHPQQDRGVGSASHAVGHGRTSYHSDNTQHAPRPSHPTGSGQSIGSQLSGGMDEQYGARFTSLGSPPGGRPHEPQGMTLSFPARHHDLENEQGMPQEDYAGAESDANRPTKKRKTRHS
ncbi:hypothetical protein GGR57DRAFT_503982 [Xylariaceae sp. FL1272]|nr:hypothetical protein GGR57DRAFT_503982 [Xylariaceae sp. FL1272]